MLAFPDSNRPFMLHTDTRFVDAGAVLTQKTKIKDVVIASSVSYHFSRTASRKRPTARECMTVLWGVGHFWQFLPGRRFNLIANSSALTRCFCYESWYKIMEKYGKMKGTSRAHTHFITEDALFELGVGMRNPQILTSSFYHPAAIR